MQSFVKSGIILTDVINDNSPVRHGDGVEGRPGVDVGLEPAMRLHQARLDRRRRRQAQQRARAEDRASRQREAWRLARSVRFYDLYVVKNYP